MNELFEILNDKYELEGLLTGELGIDEVLDDINVIDFLSCNYYTLGDVEEYILSMIK